MVFVHSAWLVDVLSGLLNILSITLLSRHAWGYSELCVCVCVCVYLRMAGRLVQLYHFVVAFFPDVTRPPLFSKTLKHLCLPKCPDSAREKEELRSVEDQHKTASSFSLGVTQSDLGVVGEAGPAGVQVNRPRGHTCHLSAQSGEAGERVLRCLGPVSILRQSHGYFLFILSGSC